MLETLRRYAQGKIATVLLSLLILSFGIWGVGDILRVHGEPPVATIGSQTISGPELQQLFQREVERIRERNPDFDVEQARKFGLDQRVLEEEIQMRAFDQAGADLGVTAPDSLIAKTIEDAEAFKGPAGGFDRTVFQQWLRERQLSEGEFTTIMRSNLTRVALLRSMFGGFAAPKAIAGPLIAYANERRTVRYVIVPPDQAGAIAPPSEADIAKFYAENKDRYMAPEYRKFTFVDIDPALLAKSITVSDADITKRYEDHKADYAIPEKRTLEQIIDQDESKIRAAAEAFKSGRSFAEIAKGFGKTENDIQIGEKTKEALSPKLAAAVFSTPENGIAGPVEGDFGWTLVHVVKISPATERTLAQEHDAIAAAIAKERAQDQAYKLANKLDEALGNSTPIEVAAKVAGVEAVSVPPVDATGKEPQGAPVAALQGKDAILADAFKTPEGTEPQLSQTSEGAYHLIRIDGITKAAPKPLANVSDEVRKSIEAQRRQAALMAKAEALAARGKAGESLDSLGSSVGRAPEKSKELTRDSQSDVFSQDAIESIFRTPQGGFLAAPVHNGDGVLLAQVDSIAGPTPQQINSAYMEGKGKLSEALGNELAGNYANELRARYKVKINEDAVKRALSGV